jgi:hypothetical protein
MSGSQERLSVDQLDDIKTAMNGLMTFCWDNAEGGDEYWAECYRRLQDMRNRGTTDGKPYRQPVGEGYREATVEKDSGRPDFERYSHALGKWVPNVAFPLMPMKEGTQYRVEADQVPTDEDAKQRIKVKVRRSVCNLFEWLDGHTLIRVNENCRESFVCENESEYPVTFPYCRKLYKFEQE